MNFWGGGTQAGEMKSRGAPRYETLAWVSTPIQGHGNAHVSIYICRYNTCSLDIVINIQGLYSTSGASSSPWAS